MYLTTLKEHCKVMAVYSAKNAAFSDKQLATATGAESVAFWKRQAKYWTELEGDYENQLRILNEVQKNG